MSTLPELLHDFHAAILTGDAVGAVAAIRQNQRLTPKQQMAIYIDGYRSRLVQAIRADYPALLTLIGGKLFDQLSTAYIENNPPEGFNLERYPYPFAVFVYNHNEDGFASNLAMLESTIAEIYMLPESEPLAPSALAGLSADEFGELILKHRVASKLLSFEYPVSDWLTAQRAGNILPRSEKNTDFLYVYRHQNNVQRVALTPAAYYVLEKLGQGLPVSQALEATVDEHPEHAETIASNLQAWFAEWMEKGFFRQ